MFPVQLEIFYDSMTYLYVKGLTQDAHLQREDNFVFVLPLILMKFTCNLAIQLAVTQTLKYRIQIKELGANIN